MFACERIHGRGTIVTDCKGAAVVANKLKSGLRAPRGWHSRIETRIRDSIGQIEVQWMRSHLTAQQAADADLPAGYLTGNAEADLLAGRAVQETPALPPLLDLFRQAAAAARVFREPVLAFNPNTRETTTAAEATFFTGDAEDNSVSREPFRLLHLRNVRVDGPMDQREPTAESLQEQQEATFELAAPEVEVCAERVFKVGDHSDHSCVITNNGICMACRHCKRYVTTYKGTWRN
eukprot:5420809-Amphidinium_carterae.3